MTDSNPMVYVLHDFLKKCSRLNYQEVEDLRNRWSLTEHIDLLVMPLKEAKELAKRNPCFSLHQEAGSNSARVQEVAERLYSDAYPDEIYHNPLTALNAAIMIEKD